MLKNVSIKHQILLSVPVDLLYSILDGLSLEDLSSFNIAIRTDRRYSHIKKMVITKLYHSKYFNIFEASYYLDTVGTQKYVVRQNRFYYQLGLSEKITNVKEFPKLFENTLDYATKCVPLKLQIEFRKNLKNSIVDPCIALPRLHRQCAEYCVRGNFQSFLLSIAEQNYNDDLYDDTLENLKSHYEGEEQNILRQMMNPLLTTQLKNIMNKSQFITLSNIKEYLISDHSEINLIVYLIGLTDLYLQQIQNQLEIVEDPVELTMMLSLKYAHFQNTVLFIEQNLGYMFKMFKELYEELFGASNAKFSFYECVYSKWVNKMSKFHQITNSVYSALLSEQICQKIGENSLKDYLFINKTYFQQVHSMLKEQSFDLETLIAIYGEYITDISLEVSEIMLCGHSLFSFRGQYKNLQLKILEEQLKSLKSIKKLNLNSLKTKQELQQFLNQRIRGYESSSIRVCTVRKIMNLYEQLYFDYERDNMYEQGDKIIERINRIAEQNSLFFVKKSVDFEEETTDSSADRSSVGEYESDDEIEDFVIIQS